MCTQGTHYLPRVCVCIPLLIILQQKAEARQPAGGSLVLPVPGYEFNVKFWASLITLVDMYSGI